MDRRHRAALLGATSVMIGWSGAAGAQTQPAPTSKAQPTTPRTAPDGPSTPPDAQQTPASARACRPASI